MSKKKKQKETKVAEKKEAIQKGNVDFREIININFSHRKNVEIYETAIENSEVDNEKTIKVIWKKGKKYSKGFKLRGARTMCNCPGNFGGVF